MQTTYGIVMKLVFKLVGNLAHECLQKGDHNTKINNFTTQYQNQRMIVNCAINVIAGVLPSFYIFKGERI
jgi:hypothetical protein